MEFLAKMINNFYLLTNLAKNPFYMFSRILNTPRPILMIMSDIKTSSQHT